MRAGCGLLVSISGAAKPGSIASFPHVVNWVPPTMHPMRTAQADYGYGHFATGGDHCCQRRLHSGGGPGPVSRKRTPCPSATATLLGTPTPGRRGLLPEAGNDRKSRARIVSGAVHVIPAANRPGVAGGHIRRQDGPFRGNPRTGQGSVPPANPYSFLHFPLRPETPPRAFPQAPADLDLPVDPQTDTGPCL